MRGILPLAVAWLTAIYLWAPEVMAAGSVRCEVLTIEASNSGRGLDAALSAHAAIFEQRPFAAYDTFVLVHRASYDLALNAPTALALPAGLGGSIRLNAADRTRFKLALTFVRSGRKPIEIAGLASSGVPLFAAGFRSPAGVFVFGVICAHQDIILH